MNSSTLVDSSGWTIGAVLSGGDVDNASLVVDDPTGNGPRERRAYSLVVHNNDDHLPAPGSMGMSESFNEAMFLYLTAGIGIALNAIVVACILARRSQRRITSSFVVHGCALDAVKCAYCVPFATSLLRDVAPGFCAALGGSYVVIVTASGFNIVAMVCCEAYAFGERSGGQGGVGSAGMRTETGTPDDKTGGSVGCAVFGVLMVYIGSIIVHLGPTIIGGDFNYNDLIGNCIFVYGTIKSYVVQTMWIAIMTLAMAGAVYYLIYFDRHVRANSTHRLAALVRASVAISRGNTSVVAGERLVRAVVRQTLSRSRVLIVVTALFIFSWYPLYILTLVDPKFQQPTKIYKLLTFVAWSNAAVNPVVLILFDHNIGAFRRLFFCRYLLPGRASTTQRQQQHHPQHNHQHQQQQQYHQHHPQHNHQHQQQQQQYHQHFTQHNHQHQQQQLRPRSHELSSTASWIGAENVMSNNWKPPTSQQPSRLQPARNGDVEETAYSPPSPETVHVNTESTPRRANQSAIFVEQSPYGASTSGRHSGVLFDRPTVQHHPPPSKTVYDRVGSRLWREGELSSPPSTLSAACSTTLPSKTASGPDARRHQGNGRLSSAKDNGGGCGNHRSSGRMTVGETTMTLGDPFSLPLQL